MNCPHCQTEATRVGEFWVCPKHGQLPEPKPFAPLRIFLSYGHDANEPLVRRIKTDLEKRGHDVWFDKNDIRPGDNWRRSITDGILHCDRFLSFLSKHSTRDPGVCRDEIAISIGVKDGNIQTILVESETEVQPPVSISHVQWLDMHDWMAGHGTVQAAKDQPATGDAAWESWYQGKLADIRRIVESEQSRQFAGEIEKLNEYLKPIKSHARIKQLLEKGFFGRQWLFDAVEQWRAASKEGSPDKGGPCGTHRLFWITGDPGVGKSAFAAQLAHTRPDAVIAAQFVEWDKPDHRDARRVVRSLAFQLATRLPDYRKLLLTLPEIAELDRKDPAELFDYLLANPLRSVIGGGRERQLIVIDALDEAGEAGRNPLVEMLARHAPRLSNYSIRWGMSHLRAAGRFRDAGALLRDNRFRQKRVEMGLSRRLSIRERFFDLSSILMRWAAKDMPRFQEFVEAKDAYEAFIEELRVRFDQMSETHYQRALGDQRLRIAALAFAEAAELSEREGKSHDTAVAKYQLGLVRHVQGKLDEAAPLMRAAVGVMSRHPQQDRAGLISACHYHLGILALKQGRLTEAVQELQRSRQMDEAKGDIAGVQTCDFGLAACAKAGADARADTIN